MSGLWHRMKEGWCELHDHHRFCVRHLAVNFSSAHSKKGLKDKVVQLASQKRFGMMTTNHAESWNNAILDARNLLIQEAMCMCGKWQNYRIPCSHLIAYCAHVKMNHEMFVGEWYKLENVSKVYGKIFEPIPNKGEQRWPMEIDFPKVIHDKDVEKKKGRRKSTRFQNEIDYQGPRGNKKGTSKSVSAP
ncbi:hypothetical protein POM88_032501 [Heracleum sosnowskyi]|uniref:SWIM-type domain-containing protein n=1 Tax=Heracleum sosnowskyi TaxID=360622 RepID=A0AAD8MLB6_9APIA|nr:hypothetical protein POM88_032501 [Heracleum sosnowskyi]